MTYSETYQFIMNDLDLIQLQDLSKLISSGSDLSEYSSDLSDFSLNDLNDRELIQLLGEIKDKIKDLKEDEESINEESYLIKYDFSNYQSFFESWEVLNKDNLPYPEALLKIIIPKFYPLPDAEIQNKVLASALLINSAVIPPLGDNCGKEPPIPICGLIGNPGTGKTQITHFLKNQYPKWAREVLKENCSGFGICEKLHDLCFVEELSDIDKNEICFRPSLAIFDNIYYHEFINRLAHHYVTILSVERSEAIAYIGSKNNRERLSNVYYCHTAKWFTTVQYPVKEEKKISELLRRCLLFFTEDYREINNGNAPESAGSYNWSSLKKHYFNLWNKKDVESKFFEHLSKIMSLKDDSTVIPPNRFAPSQLIIANGLYFGYWKNINEACHHLKAYWELVDNYTAKNRGELIFQLVDRWLKDNYFKKLELYEMSPRYKDLDKSKILQKASFELRKLMNELENKSENVYKFNSTTQTRVTNYLIEKGFTIALNADNKPVVMDKSISS